MASNGLGSTVSFHDIYFEVDVRKFPWSCPNRRVVLSGLSGFMPPGMNAIMGPTGCGKSSLLDVLAGRKDPDSLSGYVLLDGHRQSPHIHRHLCGYVVQKNIAVGTLTVRENIAFSASLRLPSHLTPKQRKSRVSSVIEQLGLVSIADQLLGTDLIRGVSGGERKRTCIGIELVKDPLVLYLDEPTTGLDAYMAYSVMETLRRLADSGRTIVFSIHQPKYSIYRLFDRLTLLADGQIVYHGPSGQAPIDYFGQLGYVLEGYNNPADFLMDTLHGESTTNLADPTGSDEFHDQSPRSDIVRLFVAMWRKSTLFHSCIAALAKIVQYYEMSLPNRSTSKRFYRTGRRTDIPPDCAELNELAPRSVPLAEEPRCSVVYPPTDYFSRLPPLENRPISVELGSSTTLLNRKPASNAGKCGPDPDLSLDSCGNFSYPSYSNQTALTTNIRSSSPVQRFQNSQYSVSFCRQLCLLTYRQCLSMIRDYKTVISHFLIQFIVALFLGVIYYDLDDSIESGIQNRVGLFFFTCMQLMFINSSMLDSFTRDLVLFSHETTSGFYRVSSYFLSKLVSEILPVKALPALLFLPLTYYLAGLRQCARAFLLWELTVTLLTITSSAVSFSVSTMTTDVRIAATLLSMFFMLMMITGGFLINITSLGEWIRWLRYLSIVRLSMNIFMISEMFGVRFCKSTVAQNFSSWERTLNASITSTSANTTALVDVVEDSCIYGEQYLDTQAIGYGSPWAVWLNVMGIFIVFLLALLNAYIYLRLVKRYQ